MGVKPSRQIGVVTTMTRQVIANTKIKNSPAPISFMLQSNYRGQPAI
jgi:hypothetical protein